MADDQRLEALKRQIFQDKKAQVYAVLDGASIKGLPKRLAAHESDHVCLFSGALHPEVAETAPYLVHVTADSPLSANVLEKGWGNHWGIFALLPTDLPFRDVRRHFRTFLRVRDPAGKPLFFRYYDPRVLRVYLPTCNAAEAETIFGPVKHYLVEDEEPDTLLRFSHRGDEVHKEPVELLPKKPAPEPKAEASQTRILPRERAGT